MQRNSQHQSLVSGVLIATCVLLAGVLWSLGSGDPAPPKTPQTQFDQPAFPGETKPETTGNRRPGQPGHYEHLEWTGEYPTLATINDMKVVRSFAPPSGFIGNMAFDTASNRLWLVSLGPPTNTSGPSILYELNPTTGQVIRQAKLPLRGDLAEPVYLDGYLYQGVYHESNLYKINTAAGPNFGKIAKIIKLPTINDLKLVNEYHPLPFIEFGGVTVTPEKKLMIHADDVGEYITLDPETGALLERVRTIKAMGGIEGTKDKRGRFLVVGNSDPRGGYCALSYPPTVSRSPRQRDISWALTDGRTGEVLASLRQQNSEAYASTLTLRRHEEVPGTPYGRFSLFALGEKGILEIEWTPGRDAS